MPSGYMESGHDKMKLINILYFQPDNNSPGIKWNNAWL